MSELRATPQNAALGAIARALQGTHDFVSKPFGYENPPVQMLSELLGLPATARTVERMSYGEPLTTGRGMTTKPREDTVDAALTVAPMIGPLGRYAKRVGTNLVQTAPYVARDILESTTSPLRSYAVKPKGGNWAPAIGSTDSVEASLRPLRPNIAHRDDALALGGEYERIANTPEGAARIEQNAALDKWLGTKLQKYIRNDMGTPDDPIRLAHEEGYSHIPGNLAEDFGSWLPEDTATMRRKAGYPEEGFAAKKHADAGYPEDMEANTRKAELWENLADTEITSSPAGAYQEQWRMARDFPDLVGNRTASLQMAERNPWIEKLDRETPIYKIDNPVELNTNLGFGHLSDELRNMLDPESGLPANLRLTPEQLDKISVKQMVEKVDAVNKWRAEEASRAELEGMMGNLTASARLEDPTTKLSFVDQPGMKWVDVPETTDPSGMKLCTTIGKQGGWCTQGEGLAKSYGSGDNRLVALLDAEGRPHAQAKITTRAPDPSAMELGDALNPEDAYGDQIFRNAGQILADRGFGDAEDLAMTLGAGAERELPQAARDMLNSVFEQAEQMIPKKALAKPDITELKPPGNTFSSDRASEYAKRDPKYKAKVTDSVLKFLNSGDWGKVSDLNHYGIVDLGDSSAVMGHLDDIFDGSRDAPAIFNAAIDASPIDTPRFMSRGQFIKFMEPFSPEKGYAEGGSVTRAGEGLPDPTLMNLTLYADTVSREMFPNERDNPKRDAARHMLASALAAQKTTPTIAGLLGKAHELKEAPFRTAGHWLGLSEPRADYPTDVHNNDIGIQLGRDNRTLQELLDSVEREAKRGTPETQKGRASLKPDAVSKTRYAEGGMVGSPLTTYDPMQVDQIMNSINAPRNYAEGGSVTAYDSGRVDAILNQFM